MIYLKSSSEIEIMRSNGKILIEVFDRLAENIKPGITTKDIDNLVENIILSRLAVPSFKGYTGGGKVAFPSAACVSVNEEILHGIPGSRTLHEGDIVSVDVGAYKNGFHIDACRTYGVGKISDEAQALIDTTRQSFFEGIAHAKPGNRLSDISHAIGSYLDHKGYGIVREFSGHGIGRSLHEAPSILNYGVPGKGPKLRVGLVLAIEPMVTLGDHNFNILSDGWTVVTKDRKLSAHYENTVAITQDGCSILTLK